MLDDFSCIVNGGGIQAQAAGSGQTLQCITGYSVQGFVCFRSSTTFWALGSSAAEAPSDPRPSTGSCSLLYFFSPE